VILSREYLDDPARVFPVVLDPEVDLAISGPSDTWDNDISHDQTEPRDYMNPYLRIGYYTAPDSWRRSLIRWDLSGVDIPVDWYDYSYILIKQCSGPNTEIQGYRNTQSWSSQTVTWYNAPSLDPDSHTTINYYAGYGWWWKLWTTTPVQRWLSGTWPNYGWTFKYTGEWSQTPESAVWYYSSDHSASRAPQLHIVYAEPPNTLTGYPSYTYSDTIADSTHLRDPLNIYFCDDIYGGTYGSATVVRDMLDAYTTMSYPIPASDQHVLFQAYGGSQWVENNHQLGAGPWLGPRWHLRLFEDPYVSPAGHDMHENTVGGVHHEGLGHNIDMHWEDAERDRVVAWEQSRYSFNAYISQSSYQNHEPGYINGWWSDGKMSVMWLYP